MRPFDEIPPLDCRIIYKWLDLELGLVLRLCSDFHHALINRTLLIENRIDLVVRMHIHLSLRCDFHRFSLHDAVLLKDVCFT